MKKQYLKNKNSRYLWIFVAINIAIFFSAAFGAELTSSSITYFWGTITAKEGLIATCIPLITIILNGLLDNQMKARLVFFRWKNPLPGCRVFTHLINNDPRIDIKLLKSKHGELPTIPKDQNSLWYRIYKKHEDKISVSESHRVYLLTRDLTSFAGMFLILFPVGVFLIDDNIGFTLVYCAILLLQFIILSKSARNYGQRYVLNVLAEDSHDA